jgi:type I restriction enzyme M protein
VDTTADDDFEYEERLNEIHIELEGLNEEATQLAQTIMNNYKELAL